MIPQRLGRVARTISGVGFPVDQQGASEGDLPFLKVSDLALPENKRSLRTAANWITLAQASALGVRRVPEGAIVFPKVGAALLGNARGVVGRECAIDNNMMAVVPNDGDPRYWLHLLSTVDMGTLNMSGTLPFISDSAVRDLQVRVPPSEEQARIAGFLDDQTTRIDRIIAARKQQIALVSEQTVTLINDSWGELAHNYGTVRAGYWIAKMEQGWSPEAESREAEPHEWAVVKAGCVNGGIFRESEHKALPAGLSPQVRYLIHGGDLLMSRASGSVDLIGSVAIVPASVRDRLLLCDKVYRIAVDPSRVSIEYMAAMLRTPAAREHIRGGVSGAEGMANNLPTPVVRGVPVPAAPVASQDSIAAEFITAEATRDAAISGLDRSIDLIQEFKRSLISAAVSGEFDVSAASGRGVPA